MNRPAMLPEFVTYYDHDLSEKPDKIRVSFEDGNTEIYDIRIEQPHPVIMENIRIIRRMKNGYQPRRRRRG